VPDGVSPVPLPAGVALRLLRADDGPALAAAYTRDRARLEPWEPTRPETFFTADGQADAVRTTLREHDAGRCAPFVLEHAGRVVGRVTLNDVVGGAFCNAHLGYWLAGSVTGRGVMTAAVEATLEHARDALGLHRVQAATLADNAPSQAVLVRTGFERIGFAPRYLRIAGRWQDHMLFQRILHDD